MTPASAEVSRRACLGALVGCTDRAGPPLAFTRVDVAGSGTTTASGSNAAGDFVGAAKDSTGVQHGFVARRPRR